MESSSAWVSWKYFGATVVIIICHSNVSTQKCGSLGTLVGKMPEKTRVFFFFNYSYCIKYNAMMEHFSAKDSVTPCYSSVGKESNCNTGDPGSIPGSGRSPGEGIGYPLQYSWASLVAQLVKNPPAIQETWV